MKKTYNKPQAQVVNLYGEDVMLGASPVYDVDATKETIARVGTAIAGLPTKTNLTV